MTQEFNISVTPIGGDEYLVRTEWTPDVTAAEERVHWPVQDWLAQASLLMNDPLLGLLRGDALPTAPQQLASGATGAVNLVEFGQTLYNALFQGMLRDSWMRAQGIAQHRREVLRLRLGLKDDRLPCLPWEVLHAGDRPLATGTDVAFSRYHTKCAPLVPSPLVELDEPLRILMVLAAPSDQERLALRQEAKDLKHELESTIDKRGGQIPDIKVEILDQPDRAQLTQALEHKQYQVLHYAGHSNVGSAGGSLYLVNRTTGLTEKLSGDDLAGLLVNNGIRMAVFNSCRGVYTATSHANQSYGEGNLAEALVKRGIPAVLAMAERIPDDVALNLSRLFYRNLRRAYPVDLSLNRARQGLVSIYGSNQLYWAIPTLYMHPEFTGFLQPFAPEVEDSWTAPPGWEAASTSPRLDEYFHEGKISSGDPTSGQPANPFDDVSYSDSHDLEGMDLEDFEGVDLADMELPEPDFANPVAQMVHQLSRGSAPTSQGKFSPASPEESLLPDLRPVAKGLTRSGTTGAGAAAVASFSELEGMLADTNRLTRAIAACIQATQADPSNAQAYGKLGQVLAAQGHLSEAIAAYNQALQLNPHAAEIHNDLGSTQFRQGNVEDAIRSYSMAVHLNPGLMDAQHNLRTAKQRQVVGIGLGGASDRQALLEAPATVTPPRLTPEPLTKGKLAPGKTPDKTPDKTPSSLTPTPLPLDTDSRPAPLGQMLVQRKSLWWLGGAAAMLTVGGLAYSQINRPVDIHIVQSSPTVIQNAGDWQKATTAEATAKATELLNQGKIDEARPVLESLLDRGALQAASAAIKPMLQKQPDNPTLVFLMGRFRWQARLGGDKTYKVEDSRRDWETAVKLQPTPTDENALGFAYYEEGNLDRAGKTWLRAIKLAEQQSGGGDSPELLTAYAGMALTLAKTAEKSPPSKAAEQLQEAVKLRQKVMTSGAANFSPEALATKDWRWSEKAIADWQTLQSK